MIVITNHMDYLVRFVQVHESFRRPELEALAALANVHVELLTYSERVGFPSMTAAVTFVSFSSRLQVSDRDRK